MHVADDSPEEEQVFVHAYASPGVYTLSISCWNDAGLVSRSLQLGVQVHLEPSIAMTTSYTPAAVPLDVTFLMTQADVYTFPNNINMTCMFDHAGDTTAEVDETQNVSLPSSGWSHTHTYIQDSTSGYVITYVTCSNDVSSVSFEFNVTLRQVIVTSAFAAVQAAFERGTPASFRVDITSGSHVTSVIDFGDGQTLNLYPDQGSQLDRTSWLVEHVYTDIGNYTVTLRTLYNEIFSDDTTISDVVVIQNRLVNLVFEIEHPLVTYDDAPASNGRWITTRMCKYSFPLTRS